MQIITENSKSTNQQKIVIYTRNTAWEQPVGHRLYRDIQVLNNRYERSGYKIGKVYWEPSSFSGKKERHVLKQLLDAAKGLFWAVLVWDVYSLTSDGEELRLIESELARLDVELCSATETFDISTEEGREVFECMCDLLQFEHLASKQDMSLSALARLILTKGACRKGGELNAANNKSARPA